MIVDDSIIARTVLSRMVEGEDDLVVVASANTAEHAIDALRSVQVDVVLLDLEMPGIGGLDALPKIIDAARGARILVVSALTVDGADQTLAALSLGAADTLPKPTSRAASGTYPDRLLRKIRALGRVPGKGTQVTTEPFPAPVSAVPAKKSVAALAIGSSTGGIHALGILFRAMPRRLGVPILLTQHLPASFMAAFARQMRMASGLETLVAADGMPVLPDQVLIAPGDAHLTIAPSAGRMRVKLDRSAPVNGCLPSVDPMFASLADEYGEQAMGVVLSGMGRDGANGAVKIVGAGGSVLAQDEETSAVWGMPRAVAALGVAAAVLPPDQIASRIAASVGVSPWK